jgi:glycosyltransferase involved in cell wall biosynthesis
MTADILLATYQGADYIKEQIESLLSQTYTPIRILARDDGSTDRTLEILKTYSNHLTIIPNGNNGGIRNNFSELLQHSTADYVFFSDQDDIWLPNKVADTIKELKWMERKFGRSTPLLVHTDLKVVKKDLSTISPSFWHYANLKPKQTSLNRLLVQNNITGCTMGMNRALIKLTESIPSGAIMHDWWVGLVASCFGHIGHLKDPTMLYRQHTTNDTGAKKNSMRAFMEQSAIESTKKATCEQQTYEQAKQFLECYGTKMNPTARQVVETYINLKNQPYLKQKQLVLKHQFFKQGFLRNVKAFLSIGS